MRPVTPRLSSARLDLQPLEVAHAGRVLSEMQEPQAYRYIARDPPASLAQLRAMFERFLAGPSRPGESWHNWIAALRTSGAPVGGWQATILVDGTAHLGYWVAKAFLRQGYGREATSSIIAWLRAVGVSTAVATVDTRNVASAALLRSLGFCLAGITRDAEIIHGERTDEARYELALPGSL
jgi:ribosomal-protein-alanine N-acetyltransferase